MNLSDSFVLDGVRRTADGYITAFAKVARTGIQVYRGHELGRPDLDSVRVYRPPEEVFSADAMRSLANRPVTLKHPPVPVTARNWRKYAGGQTGEDVVRDGDFVRVPMVMMDQGLIDAYEKQGVKELSMGYSTDIQWRTGVTDSGEPYDAVQTAIRGNHLAVVPVARGGDKLRIGDEWSDEARAAALEARLKKGHEAAQKYNKAWNDMNHAQKLKMLQQAGMNNRISAAQSHALLTEMGYHDNEIAHMFVEPGYPSQFVRFAKKNLTKDSQSVADAATKTCPNCGATVDADEDECPECGYEFDDDDNINDNGELNMKTMLVDGITVSVADDQSMAIIERHVKSLRDSIAAKDADIENLKKKQKDDEEEMTDAKTAMAAKDGEIAVLKKAVADAEITPAKLDSLVKDRLEVIEAAAKILPKEFAFDGKTLPEIKRATVELHLGDAAKGMDDATIGGAFVAATAKVKDDGGSRPIRDAFAGRRPGNGAANLADEAVKSHDEMTKRLSDAWRTPNGAAA